MMVICLFSMFLAAQALDGKKCVYNFCVDEGLYGLNFTIRIGQETMCEIPASHSPHNVTCDDGSLEALLKSNNSAEAITLCNISVFLEVDNKSFFPSHETVCPRKSNVTDEAPGTTNFPETLSTPKIAFGYDITNSTDEAPETNSALYWFLRIGIPVLVVAGILIGGLIYWQKKKSRSYQGAPQEEARELQVIVQSKANQATDAAQNGINGHAAQDEESSFLHYRSH